MAAIRGHCFKRRWRRFCRSSKPKSSNARISPRASRFCRAAGLSSAASHGSTAAAGSPRIGKILPATHAPASASPPSASCAENSAIPHKLSGRTLINLRDGLLDSVWQYCWGSHSFRSMRLPPATHRHRGPRPAPGQALQIGGMHDGVQQQTLRVYKKMALLALNLLAGVITVRINRPPPWSALRGPSRRSLRFGCR